MAQTVYLENGSVEVLLGSDTAGAFETLIREHLGQDAAGVFRDILQEQKEAQEDLQEEIKELEQSCDHYRAGLVEAREELEELISVIEDKREYRHAVMKRLREARRNVDNYL